MTFDTLLSFCLALPGTTESTPFDHTTMVFKVMGKMFCLADMEEFTSVNVKCEVEKAIDLRERYPEVLPGYHMNKQHWNTVVVNGGVSDQLVFEWIKDSYDLIVKSLPKKTQIELANR